MLINLIKIAFRNLLKSKIFTLINILGLSVGIASCLMILIHVEDELSYDNFHQKGDQIHKLVLERLYPDHVTNYAITPHSYADVLARDLPEVNQTVRVFSGGINNEVLVRYIDEKGEENIFEEDGFIAADSNFFDVFSFKLLKGNKKTALSGAQDMVITERMATKYYGAQDPIGKVLNTDFGEFTISGVVENVPKNSHLEFDFISALKGIQFIFQNENFVAFSTHIYLEVQKGADVSSLEDKLPQLVETYAAPQIESNLNTTYEAYVAAGNGYNYSLIPLSDIHLYPVVYQGEFKSGGDINDIYIFISIAFLILLIACINFMNLSTARSTERAKEVGIRKTLGSPKSQLIGQFLVESMVLTLIATIVAVGAVVFLLPYFNQLAEKSLVFNFNSWSILFVLGSAVLVGLLAGSYPAFVLSGFNPVNVLKGKVLTNRGSAWLRNGLVVFQFAISIILITGTLIVQKQLDYIKNKDLGYDRDRVLAIERIGALDEQQETFIEELRALPDVIEVGASSGLPVNQFFGIQFLPQGATESITANGMSVDDRYAEAMGLELVEGRTFSKDYDDSLSIVINQAAAELLDVDNPVGLKVRHTTPGDTPVYRLYEIVGIVKDFHYMTLKDQISPFVMVSNESAIGFNGVISAKLSNDNYEEAIAAVAQVWNKFVPEEPIKYKFLNDELYDQYKTEANSGRIFAVFAILAIVIACVGLFGLAAYMAGLRTKEIGIRKVMGSSVFSVVLLLSKDFTKLIAIALILAIPLSWYFMNEWLANFAYKTSIGFDTYLISGLVALAIGWLTVSYQSIKAAVVNPVKSLKDE
ncbi:ABC transporter permease [Fulvivirga sp. RKSG066]|uniref:ABC transporter permease n=1 Tax=Fulvivirga aurantia TaxID=2529383 RepID=UPI0012BBEFC0|nr:ABC transporter permease [Fulvivirga aurantia]MTI22613.1 ABC transporter permease [Fulvivirga aurantia]